MGVGVQVGVGVSVGDGVGVGVRLGVGLGVLVGVVDGARVGAMVVTVGVAGVALLLTVTVVVTGKLEVVAVGGGPPKAPVTGVSGGAVTSSGANSRVGLGRITTLSNWEVGVGERFAAAGVTTPVPIGTPATKKPIVSKMRAKAYPVRERNEKGRLPRRAKTGD